MYETVIVGIDEMKETKISLKADLENLVDISAARCQSWLRMDSQAGIALIDPIDRKEVKSHYGDSHLAAALIILGKMREDYNLEEKGVRLVETIIRDWQISIEQPDFHHDFNNFALCLIDESLGDNRINLKEKIRNLVAKTRDSNHETINWLPMRAYVNLSRYEWTGKERYRARAKHSLSTIQKAINKDGSIEDRLPVGRSYNLQYNISSLAALQLLSRRWNAFGLKIERSLDFLLDQMLPDGDINYIGRGANQIFAWGTWLYVLSSSTKTKPLKLALQYLAERYPVALENMNVFLNNFQGSEKLFWWDYHYCSVYHPHFLLWSVLALRDYDRYTTVTTRRPKLGTGLVFHQAEFGGVVCFGGRTEYLSEAGPAVCALWIKDRGTLYKGGLGPWQGAFGRKYSFADTVFQNHFGFVSQSMPIPILENGLFRKIAPSQLIDRMAILRPVFTCFEVEIGTDTIEIIYETKVRQGYLNIPIFQFQNTKTEIRFFVDEEEIRSSEVARIKNQYGWVTIFRSGLATGKLWKVTIH